MRSCILTVLQNDPRYPIGSFEEPLHITHPDRLAAIATLAEAPGRLRQAREGLSASQLDTPYREGGWTIRQLLHHVADSHMNALIRVRLALTEDWPTIKPYNEGAWAELADSEAPVEWSLGLLDGIHARWVLLLESLDESQFQRGYVHPESGPSTVERATLMYAWHSRHHTAHITQLRLRENW
jgi:uncharacterized damage-inducible protein DinB